MTPNLEGICVLLLREILGKEARRLRRLGARVIHAPILAKQFIHQDRGRKELWNGYQWVIFTSASGVKALAQGRKLRPLPRQIRLASVGPETARAVFKILKRKSDFLPRAFTTRSLAKELPLVHGERVLLIRSSNADSVMDKILIARGARVRRLNPYRLSYRPLSKSILRQLKGGGITHVFFGSRSQVEAFAVSGLDFLLFQRKSKKSRPDTVQALAIGPETAKALKRFGIPCRQAKVHTFNGLIDLLL